MQEQHDIPEDTSLEISLLRQDYDQRLELGVALFQRYDRQVQTVTVYTTILGAVSATLLSLNLPFLPSTPSHIPRAYEHWLFGTALILGISIAFFFHRQSDGVVKFDSDQCSPYSCNRTKIK